MRKGPKTDLTRSTVEQKGSYIRVVADGCRSLTPNSGSTGMELSDRDLRDHMLSIAKIMSTVWRQDGGLTLAWAQQDGFTWKSQSWGWDKIPPEALVKYERECGTAEVAYRLIMDRWPSVADRTRVRKDATVETTAKEFLDNLLEGSGTG